MKYVGYVVVFAVVVLLVLVPYVRFAPTDAARWHVPIDADSDADLTGGAIRVVDADAAAFRDVDRAARGLPRTRVLAGSPAEGRITYVTRSKTFGFPDYTTVEYDDGVLKLYGRLRFGRSDMGVNRERLERLLRAAQG